MYLRFIPVYWTDRTSKRANNRVRTKGGKESFYRDELLTKE